MTAINTATSDIESESGQLSLSYGYPVSEYASFRFGGQFTQNSLLATNGSSLEQIAFVTNNGDSTSQTIDSFFGPLEIFQTDYSTLDLILGYNYDSRNNYLFATRGQRIKASLTGAIPGSDVEYYSASFNYLKYFPISNGISLSYRGDLAFAEEYGDTTILPPSKNLFSSNSNNVRGFRANYLGPRDSNQFPFGGNSRVINSLDLYLPVPEKLQGSMRYSLFADVGGVFYHGNTGLLQTGPFFLQNSNIDFDVENFRASAGISVEWLSPLGLIGLSYGTPLREFAGDDIERLQFNVSQGF